MNSPIHRGEIGDCNVPSRTAQERDADRPRAIQAQRSAAQAFERLLQLAETRDGEHICRVARFLASTTYIGILFPFDLLDLRAVDVAISDDMLACLDGLRWGKDDLEQLVPNGLKRVEAVIERWGLAPAPLVRAAP